MKFQHPQDLLRDKPSLVVPHLLVKKGYQHLGLALILVACVSLGIVSTLHTGSAKADVNVMGADNLRTGWYSTESNLSPATVSGGSFGKLFSSAVNGQIYAQPLVSRGVLFVATEMNNIYGFDAVTGAQKWTRNLGTPFDASSIGCSDITPAVGITGTPVIDATSNIAYFTVKTYFNNVPAWYMHAVSVATGTEQKGFPVQIQGSASNDPSVVFDASMQLQRPGLLLLNGVIYASFGGHCDLKPYEGWISGVSTAGKLTTLWSDEAGPATKNVTSPGGGIWMPGGALVSDGPNRIIFSSGNGLVPPIPSAGKTNIPATLGQTVSTLNVQPDGSLKAVDFFSPYDSALLNATDSDLGAGSVMELPAPYFGTKTDPHILVQAGKQGYIYLLNADNLGGRGEGPEQSDAVINRIGPDGGLWSKPAVWPGNGGYVYMTTAAGGKGSGNLKAYQYKLDGNGNPTLVLAGVSYDSFGFGSSSPVVTSSGVTNGSAVVWTIWEPNQTGVGAQLRAYNALPVNGKLHLIYSAPIGIATKFTVPAVDNNRVYVGTRDGHILAFGAPINVALSGSSLDLGSVIAGKTATAALKLTATTNLTVNSLALSAAPFTAGVTAPVLPAQLKSGQSLMVPITFSPQTYGLAASTMTVTTSQGPLSFGISGNGESPKGLLTVSASPVSFGGMALGDVPTNVTTTFTNVGATPVTFSGFTLPKAPFSVSGMPALNATLAPSASVTVTIIFSPQKVGSFISALILNTNVGQVKVPMSGNAGTPGRLTIKPLTNDFGDVPIGTSVSASFVVSNTGGSPLTITRSKYPVKGVGIVPTTTLAEGTVIMPGTSLKESVLFTPNAVGSVTDVWQLNSSDGSGIQLVTFTGTGVRA